MTLRFQADADLNQIIVLAANRREPTLDCQTAIAGGLIGLTDPEVLSRSAHEGRVLVTHDHRTMPQHFSEFISKQTSSGVLIVSQSLPVAAVVEDLLLIHAATEAKDWINRLGYLPV